MASLRRTTPSRSDFDPGMAPESYRRKRRAVNCEECRRSKLRCDRQHPCGACKRRRREDSCTYEVISEAPVSVKRRRTPVTTPGSAVSSSAPGQRLEESISETNRTAPGTHWETVLQRPAPEQDAQDAQNIMPLSFSSPISLQELIDSLPPRGCCDYLVAHFFKHIYALFPILHSPTFQAQYMSFMQRPHYTDLSWLALLFSMCSLALHAMDESGPRLAAYVGSQRPSSPTAQVPVTVSLSRRLVKTAVTCLLQDEFLIRHKFSTFEALLMVIYNLSHNESVNQGWALLGMALNMGIALRCNVDQTSSSPIETERRRRCWAGLLTLHTYQGLLFRDVDMSSLLNIKATPPADVNDSDITDQSLLKKPPLDGQPTQMSVMMAKLRLFRLSTEICHHISGPSRLDQRLLRDFDAAITKEQQRWDSTYTVDGFPNILDPNSYAYWCVLQTYAHHLYLLLHRPFHHSKAPCFLPASRERCINSGKALISIHRQLYETPLLRNYVWLLNGLTSLKALHAAVALNSCLQDTAPSETDPKLDLTSFQEEIEKLTVCMQDLSRRGSNICFRAYQILCHLQVQTGTEKPPQDRPETDPERLFEDLPDIREWVYSDPMNWDLDDLDGDFSAFAP